MAERESLNRDDDDETQRHSLLASPEAPEGRQTSNMRKKRHNTCLSIILLGVTSVLAFHHSAQCTKTKFKSCSLQRNCNFFPLRDKNRIHRRQQLQRYHSGSIACDSFPNNQSIDATSHWMQYVDNTLAKASSDLGLNKDVILTGIDRQHALDSKACLPYLTSEDTYRGTTRLPRIHDSPASAYEWLYTNNNKDDSQPRKRLAIQTKGKPVFDASTISWIRHQAQRQWNDENLSSLNSGTTKSRFTYQRPGNYEAHLADLIHTSTNDDEAGRTVDGRDLINHQLQESIYPTIRNAFGEVIFRNSGKDNKDCNDQLSLCLYDAIVIRYNATEAQLANKNIGFDGRAGQPLHRDLGLVSVNIMLNSNDEFNGGGTFFEDQLLASNSESTEPPIRPIGPGHAVMHLSSDRHAGSGIYGGVRDILVLFVTAATRTEEDHQPQAPPFERAARLKSAARPASQTFEDPLNAALCRAYYQRLAVLESENDGEAWHYLGMALWDCFNISMEAGDDKQDRLHRESFANAAIACLKKASTITPGDARLFNNLGLVLGKAISLEITDAVAADVQQYYERAVFLHKASKMAGCDVGQEYDAAILNYGLWLANQDRFEESVNVLSQVSDDNGESPPEQDHSSQRHLRIVKDARYLLRFCQNQLVK